MVRPGLYLLRSWRTSIFQALRSAKCEQSGENNIRIQGWVRSVRKYKRFFFVDVNDGSSHSNLQVVASADLFPIGQTLSLGCSVLIEGQIVPSSHPQQDFEMSATKLQILGECNSKDYPFQPHTPQSLEYSRNYPHLRARTSMFAALLRVRNTASTAINDYFQRHEFLNVYTPVLTSSDCEGGGDVFRVMRMQDTHASETEQSREFFNTPVYLTVSGQLHAEAVTCGGMSKVYTFGPTFRAEKSHTRRHLAEFNMVEAEMVTDSEHSLEEIIEVIESLCKHTTEAVLSKSSKDLELFHRNTAVPTIKEDVANMLDKPFKRITYTEAVDILKQKQEDGAIFDYLPQWGSDLHNEHEQCLVKHFDNHPVFVMEYPMKMKPFYARSKDDEDTIALSVDLLMPNVGEVAGGTVREERFQLLAKKLESDLQQSSEYQWYLDLRKYGTVPHGGFGLGFERLIQALLGIQNIRDTIPFPRFLQSCSM